MPKLHTQDLSSESASFVDLFLKGKLGISYIQGSEVNRDHALWESLTLREEKKNTLK